MEEGALVAGQRSQKRNGAIDFWKFVFCMIIAIYHGRYMGGSVPYALFKDGGYLAVEFFFLVSGFLMAKSAKRAEETSRLQLGTETAQFIWHKAKIILPYFIFAYIVGFAIRAYTAHSGAIDILNNGFQSIVQLLFLEMSGIEAFTAIGASWYISAMLISMLALYPLLRKNRNVFTWVIAPLLAIFILGYLSHEHGWLNETTKAWQLVYPGLLRAVAELSLGCVCFGMCERLQRVQPKPAGRALLTAMEFLGYLVVIAAMCFLNVGQRGFVLLFVLAGCMTLSFSGLSNSAAWFRGRIFPWLGKMSLIVYLLHFRVKDVVRLWFPSLGYWEIIGVYLALVLGASVICYFAVEGIGKLWRCKGQRLKGYFIETDA